jgi:hypothetical protein
MKSVKILRILFISGILHGSLVFCGLALPLGWAGEGQNDSVFSLDVSNERLNDVLDRISKASGYEITVNEGWRSKIISVRLENVTLEEGLKAIMEELGRPSYLLIYDKERKRIEIVLVPASSSKSESARKVEPSAPLGRQRQAVLPTQERAKPVARPSLRRTRERSTEPTASQEKTLDHPGLEESGADSVSEKKGLPRTEPEVGGESPEAPDSPEHEDMTPETQPERKAIPQTRRRAPGAPEGELDPSRP